VKRLVLLVLLAISLVACADEDGAPASKPAASAEPRLPMPDFRLPRLGGGELASEDLHGRFLVIDFWATWCLPCEETVPELNAFHEAHREEGIVVVGISIDEGGEEVVAEWIAKHQVRYPILLSDVGLAQRFAAPGFPATYFVAPDGTTGAPHVGYLDRGDLEASLARVQAYWSSVSGLEAQASPRVGRSPDG
jgi:thiol-disulfide isomerase/thioredoxin